MDGLPEAFKFLFEPLEYTPDFSPFDAPRHHKGEICNLCCCFLYESIMSMPRPLVCGMSILEMFCERRRHLHLMQIDVCLHSSLTD